MTAKVEFDEEIRQGDVVSYTCCDADDDYNEVTFNLRIVGKLDEGHVKNVFQGDDFVAYLAVPHEKVTVRKNILDEHKPNSEDGPIVLEWGFVPKRKDLMIVVGESCYPTIDEIDSLNFVKQGLCPRCGDKGRWHAMTCECPWHGYFLG